MDPDQSPRSSDLVAEVERIDEHRAAIRMRAGNHSIEARIEVASQAYRAALAMLGWMPPDEANALRNRLAAAEQELALLRGAPAPAADPAPPDML